MSADYPENRVRLKAISGGGGKGQRILGIGESQRTAEMVREILNEVKTTGDGFHATFDGPARAILCAEAIRDATRQLGLDLRIGIHTGECEIRGDSLEGLTIHIAARVSGLAAGGEIVVSRTVRDIVNGSGIRFEDLGTHTLRGIPDAFQLFRVNSQCTGSC